MLRLCNIEKDNKITYGDYERMGESVSGLLQNNIPHFTKNQLVKSQKSKHLLPRPRLELRIWVTRITADLACSIEYILIPIAVYYRI
jgi:hypothetical protein